MEPETIDDLLLYRLSRLHAVGGAPVVRLCEGRYGITRREWRLIVVLARHGAMLSSQLARLAQLEPARTSRAVTDLVTKGLVERAPRPGDRRQVQVALTLAGQTLHARFFPEVVAINQQLLSVLSPPEREVLDACLSRLQAAADRRLAEADLPKANRRQGRRRAVPGDGVRSAPGRTLGP